MAELHICYNFLKHKYNGERVLGVLPQEEDHNQPEPEALTWNFGKFVV